MPKVSVIIPTYNGATYITKAIDSVLSQTFKDYEMIIVDDGSTDHTKEALNKYIDKMKYIYQKNTGVSSARNRGIKESVGEYIAFLDNDDLWLEDKLRLQVDIMENNPEVALIFTDGESFNSKGLFRTSLMRPQLQYDKDGFKNKLLEMEFNDGAILKDYLYEDLLISNRIFTSSVIVRTKCLLQTTGFDENLPCSEDHDLWLRISKKFPFLYFNKITARYRMNEKGISGSSDFRFFTYQKSYAVMLEKYLPNLESKYKKFIKQRIADSYKTAAWGSLDNKNLKELRHLSLRSLKYNAFDFKLYFYFLLSFLPYRIISLMRKLKKNAKS